MADTHTRPSIDTWMGCCCCCSLRLGFSCHAVKRDCYEGVWFVVMRITMVKLVSIASTGLTQVKNMPGFLSISTSKSLLLQSSVTAGWAGCSRCWGALSLQRQTLGLPGEWRYWRVGVWSWAHTLDVATKSLSLCRVHREVWNQSSVGRLQEEPQRRHSPTEDTQDLHCMCKTLH